MEGTTAGTGSSRRKDFGPLDDLMKPPTVPAPAVSLHAIHRDRNQATSIWPVLFGSLLIAFCAPFIPPPSQAIPSEPTPAASLVSSIDPPLHSLTPPQLFPKFPFPVKTRMWFDKFTQVAVRVFLKKLKFCKWLM